MKHPGLRAFTLVELIVVITIVGILSTVGFVSYSGYLTSARDSNRYSQITKLSDSLQVYSTTRSLPLPDDYIEITASGASNIVAYQGYAGTDVLETIDYTNGGKDPKDDSFFTYYLTRDRKSLQLLAFMEDQIAQSELPIANKTYANDYADRYPVVYGRKLGVLLSASSASLNTPAQELDTIISGSGYIDIVNTLDAYTLYLSTDEYVSGVGEALGHFSPDATCERIKQTGRSQGTGYYFIRPLGERVEVYCEMELAGGGWTLFSRNDSSSSTPVLTTNPREDDKYYILPSDLNSYLYYIYGGLGENILRNESLDVYGFSGKEVFYAELFVPGGENICFVGEGYSGLNRDCSNLDDFRAQYDFPGVWMQFRRASTGTGD